MSHPRNTGAPRSRRLAAFTALLVAGGGLLASGRRVSSVWAVSHCPAPFDRCVGRPDGSIVAFTFMLVKGIASAKHHMGLVTFSTL